jgi:hypothetical protein
MIAPDGLGEAPDEPSSDPTTVQAQSLYEASLYEAASPARRARTSSGCVLYVYFMDIICVVLCVFYGYYMRSSVYFMDIICVVLCILWTLYAYYVCVTCGLARRI